MSAMTEAAIVTTPAPYYDDGQGRIIYHGDALEILPTLGVLFDVVVTSPPYNKARRVTRGWSGITPSTNKAGRFADGYGQYGDDLSPAEYEAWQREALSMFWSHLTDDGVIFYNHKPRLVDASLWLPLALNPDLPLRQVIIWVTGAGVCLVPTALSPAHEWIMVFAKKPWRLVGGRPQSSMGDVWKFSPERSGDHPAPFPVELPTRVLSLTKGIVLDPFMGSGTSLVAAQAEGRQAVGIEMNEAYCEIAAKRLDSGSEETP